MKEVFIGEVIRQKRLKLGITQEELCDGICEPSNLSRIESGRQGPSKIKLDVLLQRLGISDERYYCFLNHEEHRIAELQKDIRVCAEKKDSLNGLQNLKKLERLAEAGDGIVQQFILYAKAVLGKQEGIQVVEYLPEEKLKMLEKAILLTCPHFSVKDIENGFYGLNEISVIDRIAQIYSQLGEKEKARDVYCRLLQAIQPRLEDVPQYAGVLSMVLCHYAVELMQAGLYAEAVEKAQKGWGCCIKYRRYRYLPELLLVVGEISRNRGEIEDGQKKYRQAYYIFKSIQDNENAEKVKIRAAEIF